MIVKIEPAARNHLVEGYAFYEGNEDELGGYF